MDGAEQHAVGLKPVPSGQSKAPQALSAAAHGLAVHSESGEALYSSSNAVTSAVMYVASAVPMIHIWFEVSG